MAIVGPTASGKSDLAIKIAKKFNGEIVSADSRQIYRGMDIGTAKYRPNNQRIKTNSKRIFGKNSVKFDSYSSEVRHHLIDIKNPDEDYTAADYKRDALRVIRDILRRNKLPILVGGTGLYVRAIIQNLTIPRVKADPKLRQKLEEEMAHGGLASLFKKLIALDPEAAYIVDPKNPRRVIRALEIAIKTGKPFSAQRNKGQRLFDTLQIGIKMAPEKLKENISRRVDEMMTAGLILEVGGLIKKYGAKQKAFDAIGYREIINYLRNADQRRKSQRQSASNPRESASLNEAINLIKKNTWQYARRQMTWFKKDKTIEWVKNEKQAATLVKKFLVKT